jgi:hypothetical protein
LKSAPVFLTIAALLLAQLAIPFDLQFVQGRNVVSPVMLVFGGLALGQLLFLWAAHEGRRAAELSHPYYQILFLSALFLSLGWLPALAPLAATLVFLCFGASVSRLYRAHDLTRTVRASALAGVAAAAAFPLTSMVDTVHLKTAVLALLAAAGAFERAPRSLAIAALAAVVVFPFAGRPLFPGALRRSAATADYAYRGPTYFAPLLRTDIYDEPSTGNVVAVTNGIHFARVAGPRDPEPESPVLKRPGRALMIGSAAGRSLRKMLAGGFTAVDAVDINPNAFRASLDLEGARSSYGDPRVRRIVAEGRHFLHRPGPRYDLIYLEKVKLGEPVGGLSPHFEDFLYTQEALEQMWARLSDGGAILIVENLEDRAYSLTGGGLIDELARAALCSPKMAGAHILPLEGRWRRARMRGLLAVSKTPLSAADLDASELIADVEARAPRDPSCDRVLTDERPFHSNPRGQMPYYRWALAISLLPLAPMLYRRRRAGAGAGATDALSFASGMVYILWLAGVSGLFFMFFENPALIPPLVLFASFLTGLLCFHLPSRRRYLRAAAALILIAAPLIAALAQNKNHFLAQEGWLAPLLVLSLFAPGFVLVETPYMTVLRRSGSAVRVLAFENWGCLVAIPLCFLIKAHLGFLQMALAALGAAALLCLVLAGLRPKSSD